MYCAAFIRCTTCFHSLSLNVIRCHSFSFVVTFSHSLSLFLIRCHSFSFVVTRCHWLYHSLSFVLPLLVIRCYFLSLDVPLVCLLTRFVVKEEQEILQRQSDFGKVKVSLKLFVDTLGLLRLKGRFENAALNYDEKHPLILRSLEKCFHIVDNIRLP